MHINENVIIINLAAIKSMQEDPQVFPYHWEFISLHYHKYYGKIFLHIFYAFKTRFQKREMFISKDMIVAEMKFNRLHKLGDKCSL